jgi:hypothetical protein
MKLRVLHESLWLGDPQHREFYNSLERTGKLFRSVSNEMIEWIEQLGVGAERGEPNPADINKIKFWLLKDINIDSALQRTYKILHWMSHNPGDHEGWESIAFDDMKSLLKQFNDWLYRPSETADPSLYQRPSKLLPGSRAKLGAKYPMGFELERSAYNLKRLSGFIADLLPASKLDRRPWGKREFDYSWGPESIRPRT